VPSDLPGLTATQARRLSENEPGQLTHELMILGGYHGVGFRGFSYLCMEIFVPVDSIVRTVIIASYLCEGTGTDRRLKSEATDMLNSIRFFLPNDLDFIHGSPKKGSADNGALPSERRRADKVREQAAKARAVGAITGWPMSLEKSIRLQSNRQVPLDTPDVSHGR